MTRILWQGRIVMTDMFGRKEACFKGTRIPARHIVADLADGKTPREIVAQNPELTEDDIRAALAYATDALNHLAKRKPSEPIDWEREKLAIQEGIERQRRYIESGKLEIVSPRLWRYRIDIQRV